MRLEVHTCQILKPTRLWTGGWVRIVFCKASHWSYNRALYRGWGRDHIQLRLWKFLFEYKRDPE